MKRNSIRRWSSLWFTIILLLALAVSAGWNYYWADRSAFEQADHRAGTCIEMVRQILEEWDVEKLSADSGTELYQRARAALKATCQRYLQDYLYVYTIDPGTKVRRYIICVAGDDDLDQMVRDERFLGAVSEEPLDDAEQAIMAGEETFPP